MPRSPISPLRLAGTALYLLAWPALLLALAGTLRWIQGWIFGVWFVALCAGTIGWLYRKAPALLVERYRKPGTGGQSRADTLIVYGLAVGFLAWIAVMPLDACRFRLSPRFPVWLACVGGGALALSAFFFFRSFTDNPFLSPLVRVQSERQQTVVSTGVYGCVRHPMYLGATLMFLGAPLLLGSGVGLGLGLGLVLLLMVRIRGEEKLLAAKLDGYDAYRERVRSRLIPYVW